MLLETYLYDLFWLFMAFGAGAILGTFTGLIPGFHVNNVALIAVSLTPIAIGIGLPLDIIAGMIVSCGMVHTFLNYIPSALVGAPDDNMALALLPGHRMLVTGQAAQGVAYSARGSQMGMIMAIPLLVVARLLFGDNPGLNWFEGSRDILPWLLLSISSFLLLTETTRLPWPSILQKATSWMRIPLPKPIRVSFPIFAYRYEREWNAIDLRLGNSSRKAGIFVALCFFLLSGFYGWAVFELPARSPVGMPSATLLMPSLAGLFGIANLIDIYVTTSEMPKQEPNWDLPPMKPLAVPTFLSAVVSSVMAILPGMTAAQATVVVMSMRNIAGRLRDPNFIPADFEYSPSNRDMSPEEMLAERRKLFMEEIGGVPIDDGEIEDVTKTRELENSDETDFDELIKIAENTSESFDENEKTSTQDLEVIAVLSSVNTAVTVMVLGFLYMVGRPRSGAALALNMIYPIDIWGTFEPPSDFVRLVAITIIAGLFSVPVMIKLSKGMLKLHELIPLRTMVISVIVFVSALVWFSTGFIGLGVLVIGTLMGLMPPRIGIRRSHGMGIILVPIMVYTFAQQLDGFGFI
ncbi:MAG: tripartite tricarboxylate transporter permease [Candidatus Thermoplasmatota archaeon]|nr:tripartite tricarboxylate transporter permease [Candidatus Thermoplasmatota archaeon]MEC7544060.1 tripartite tricarboxylate transporter permease [Candidatus Thermoplasmatota archaeon]MEC7687832.1 tripartite tricarboxylate transporter permease [Candidatus Thermoplasmatota archaeon]MED5375446.1 tripartite tricarboxylate transporter permease [Candidatus Thermoplasmatota archaeon]